jgi:hypothetical protein
MNLFKAFVWFNFLIIGVGVILTLCVSMFDDPRRVNGRKRGRRE